MSGTGLRPVLLSAETRVTEALKPNESRSGFGGTEPDRDSSFSSRTQTYFFTCSFNHSVVTDLGRSMGEPRARLITSWLNMPMVRLTENSTV